MTTIYEVSICCASDRVNDLEDMLEQAHAISITLRNGDTNNGDPILEGEWRITQIIALLPSQTDLVAIERTAEVLGCHGFQSRLIDKSEWAEQLIQTQADLVVGPFVIGDPRPSAKPSQIALEISAGLAFGTGAHETTAMCLEWLAERNLSGKHVLDFGCGTGILAIAAMKLGASSATAIDDDETALTIASENATKNGVKLSISDRLREENQFDLVTSNIYADTLIEYKDQVEHVLKPGGLLALSGILESQSTQIEKAYERIRFKPVQLRNDWVLLTGLKQPQER
ncbi:MAG: 50S ribosomal protein L11 methyltransferase [Gammaproteobacteria bacterium]|nr:50S ribosomal protein L11 methyltransferase [Gammaproteobacteria bacterium]